MNMVRIVAFALVTANIVNALGNWILVYGHWGAPAMGTVGSGWSTAIARLYMAAVLVVLSPVVRPPPSHRPPQNTRRHRSPAHPPPHHPRLSRRNSVHARKRRLRHGHHSDRAPRPRPSRQPSDRAQHRRAHLHGSARNFFRRRRSRRPGHRPQKSRAPPATPATPQFFWAPPS